MRFDDISCMSLLYREYIENRRRFWLGKKVRYQGHEYTVVDIDYNGALLINMPTKWTDTTAVAQWQLDDYTDQIG